MMEPKITSEFSELEKKKMCGFCGLDQPKSQVDTLMTVKVLIDTYQNL